MNDHNSTNDISDAHAFAVAQATGVNVNGSAMGDTGVSLHDSSSNKEGNSGNNGNYNNMNKQNFNKKIIKFFVIFVSIIMVGLISLFALNNAQSFKGTVKNRENLVLDKDYLYDDAVEYIKNKFHDLNVRKESEDYQVLVSYEKFGITEKDGYNYTYMWVLSESYFVKNDKLYRGRLNSSLYKITFLNDEILKYEMPDNVKDHEKTEYYVMDNENDFVNSLKSICKNNDVYNKIISYELNLSNENQVKEKYSYLNDFTIYSENLGGTDSNQSEVVPYPNDKAQGGSGYVPR